MVLEDLIRATARRLQDAGISAPLFDARQLVAGVVGKEASALSLYSQYAVSDAEQGVLESFVQRRLAREPVGRIMGCRGFWTLDLELNAATLEPRPDTETLVEAVLRFCPDRGRATRILDLGTGSGALLLALLEEFPRAWGVGIDVSQLAVECARANAFRNGFGERACFITGSWGQGISGAFDLVVSNPPYIVPQDVPFLEPEVRLYDPPLALVGDDDGLGCYRRFLPDAENLLKPRGFLAVEVGLGQFRDVGNMLVNHGFSDYEVIRDLGGIERCLCAFKPA